MLNLKDISEDLFILNKHTVDKLFSCERPSDAVSLYCFYYKTAKWQKTNSVKANDLYVKKCLGWGLDKVRNTKRLLKELGLIQVIQRREGGKVSGWYVEVSYLVSKSKTDIKVEQHNLFQDNPKATSSNQDTDALKQKIKMLEDKIDTLKKEKNKKDDEEKTSPEFEEFYSHYPLKKAPKNAWRAFKKLKPSEVEKVLEVVKSDLFQNAMSKKKNNRGDFRPQPSSWLNAGSWEDEEYSPAASTHTIDYYGDNQHMFLHHLQDDMRTIAVEQHGDDAKQKLLEFYVDAKNAGIKLTHKQWLQKLKDKK